MNGAALLVALAGLGATQPTPLYVVDANVVRGGTGSGLWRPTMRQTSEARDALRVYLRSAVVSGLQGRRGIDARRIGAGFDGYSVQVEGVRAPGPREFYSTEGSGGRQVHLDGFCPGIAEHLAGLASHQQQVFDGGSCIFQALYDMRSRRITFFASNGYA